MMNIETLLQAAQILESQQSIPPKKRLAKDEGELLSLSFLPTGSEGYIESDMNNTRG